MDRRRTRITSPSLLRKAALPAVLLAVTAVHTWPRTAAAAGKQEWALTLLPHYSMVRAWSHTRHGGGVAVMGEYGFTDSWALKATGSYAAHAVPGSDPGVLNTGLLGLSVVYTIDILQVVPFFVGGVECLVIGGKGVGTESNFSVEFGLNVGGGLDYLLNRYWSIGIEATYHIFFPDAKKLPAMVTAGFRFTRRWF